MLKNYGELLAKLLENLFDGTSDVSLIECFKIMGNGVFLMLILLILLLIISGIFLFPTKIYGVMVRNVKRDFNNALINEDPDEKILSGLKTALLFRRVVFFLLFVVFYIPICIPAVLYLISLLIY